MAVKPLRQRPLDFVYFYFFLWIFNTSTSPSWLPTIITSLPGRYVEMFGDPLVGSVTGALGNGEHSVWFRPYLYLELGFQLPVFILGMHGLTKGYKTIYPLLLAYGASTATTLLPCIAIFIATPLTSPETTAAKIVSITTTQRLMLLSSYIPFFLISLIMAIDMGLRITGLIHNAVAVQDKAKRR